MFGTVEDRHSKPRAEDDDRLGEIKRHGLPGMQGKRNGRKAAYLVLKSEEAMGHWTADVDQKKATQVFWRGAWRKSIVVGGEETSKELRRHEFLRQ